MARPPIDSFFTKPQTTNRPPLDSFFSKPRVPKGHQSIEDLKAAEQSVKKETSKGLFGRFVKELPGAALEVGVGAPLKFAASLGELLPTSFSGRATQKEYKVPGLKPFKSFISEAETRAGEIVEGTKPLHSALGPFVEVPLAGLEAVGLTKGLGKLATRKALLEAKSAKDALKIALQVVKPKMSTKEQAEAFAQGRGQYKGIFSKVELAPNARDKQVAESVKQIVKGKDPIADIFAIRTEVRTSTQKVREGVKSSQAIWNKNELKGQIRGIERPITVKSDTTLNNQASNLEKAVLQLADKVDKKTAGLLDVRQQFDDLVDKEFPNLYDREMTPMRQYIRQLRERLNQFASSKLPEGKLPDGTSFRDELKRQSLMIDAMERIAEKAPKVGSTGLQRFLGRYPILRRTLPYAAGGGATALGLDWLRR